MSTLFKCLTNTTFLDSLKELKKTATVFSLSFVNIVFFAVRDFHFVCVFLPSAIF